MDLIAGFRVFVRVAESLSFSAVARELGLTQPAVSRQVSALEEHLGARLVQRTTRSVTLTEDGRDLLGHARLLLEALERTEAAVGRQRTMPSGLVRIAVPATFGATIVAPRIHRLLARYPDLSLELILNDERLDLVHDGIDVALQFGEIDDSSLIARRIGSVSRLIVASADYLAEHPAPQRPQDLAAHECILSDPAGHPNIWQLEGPDGVVEVRVNGRFRTDSSAAVRAAVTTGLGLAAVSGWLMEPELRTGVVRAVLPDWQPPPVPIHAIYPSQRNLAPRTRAVIDFILGEFCTDLALSRLSIGFGSGLPVGVRKGG